MIYDSVHYVAIIQQGTDKHMKKKLYIIAITVSLLLTCLTVLMPCGADKAENLSGLTYGLPFTFVIQESTLTPPADRFPAYISIGSPWENPTRFRPLYFVIDWLIIAQIVIAAQNVLIFRRSSGR
jgi:hypothetical protein